MASKKLPRIPFCSSIFMPFIVTPPGEQIFSLIIAGCSCSSKALELLNKERVRLRLSSFDKPS